jgi:hypothetical protein
MRAPALVVALPSVPAFAADFELAGLQWWSLKV